MFRHLLILILAFVSPTPGLGQQCYMDMNWQGSEQQCQDFVEEIFVVGQRPETGMSYEDFQWLYGSSSDYFPTADTNPYGDGGGSGNPTSQTQQPPKLKCSP